VTLTDYKHVSQVCQHQQNFLLPARRSKRGICYGNVAIAGWVSDTRRYCIKMAKPILKLFRISGSPIILVSSDTCVDIQFQRNPFSGVLNTRGWEKLAIFDGNRRLSRKRCETGRWLLWNVNRKSWVPDRMVSFLMTLSDP